MDKPSKEKADKTPRAPKAPKPLTNRARQRIDTRNQVYEAAIAEFKRSGIANTQIEAIVSRAGVSVGTFYRYFTGRDDVLRELQRRNAALVIERAGRIRKSLDLRSYLRQLLTTLLLEEPPVGVKLEREAILTLVRSPPEPDSIETHPVYAPVTARIREGQQAGTIRADIPAQLLGRLFFHQVFGIIAGSLREHRNQVEMDALLEVFLRGIQPAPAKPATTKTK